VTAISPLGSFFQPGAQAALASKRKITLSVRKIDKSSRIARQPHRRLGSFFLIGFVTAKINSPVPSRLRQG
jgi:hypothetical protein